MTTTTAEKLLNVPPVVIAGGTVFGYSFADLNSIVGIVAGLVAIIYTLTLLFFRLRKEHEIKRLKKAGASADLIAQHVRDVTDSK